MSCAWEIYASAGAEITLSFSQFETEAGYDYLKVFDGSVQKASLSGQTRPANVTATSGMMRVQFTSDGSVHASGFDAVYQVSDGGTLTPTYFPSMPRTITPTYLPSVSLISAQTQAPATPVPVSIPATLPQPVQCVPALGGSASSEGTVSVSAVAEDRFPPLTGMPTARPNADALSFASAPSPSGPCQPSTILDTPNGVISDGPGRYRNSMQCEWQISASANDQIILSFLEFSTEQGYDKLMVYDGSEKVAELSGSRIPGDIVARSGTMELAFSSDGSMQSTGFEARYTVSPWP